MSRNPKHARATPRHGAQRDTPCAASIEAAAEYERALRRISEALRIPRLCLRTSCRRADACRSCPRRCIEYFAPFVPLAARRFVVDLPGQQELGCTPEETIRNNPDAAREFFAWQKRFMPPRGQNAGR